MQIQSMTAFAVLVGCALIAWAIYSVGRQIARVLWGILCSIENDAEQREILEAQSAHLFGDDGPSVKTRAARERGDSVPQSWPPRRRQ